MDWPFAEGARAVSQFHVAASSQGNTVATAVNSKPTTPTEIVASTAFDACGILVNIGSELTASTGLVDIMAGSSTNEYVIVPDLLCSVATGGEAGYTYFFPIFIPKGTRLSGRASISATGNIRINVHLLQGSFGSAQFSKVTAYGANVSTSNGTTIDPGATANTKPALPATQIVASTADPVRLLTLACGNNGIYVRTPAANLLLDLMLGASSSEYNLIDNIYLVFGTSMDAWFPRVPVVNVPLYVPKGSRLSARAQCSGTDATERATDIIVYGVS